MTAGAFFVRAGAGPHGERFVGTTHTAGPWDPQRAMHFGPPAALLGRALEAADNGDGKRVTRITFEVLGPVPIGAVSVGTRTVRPGRRVDLVEAVLCGDDGAHLALARAWRMRTARLDGLPAVAAPSDTPPPGPEQAASRDFFTLDVDVHYGTSVEARFVSGGFNEPGPATVWMRMRIPLIEDEEPSPLTRVLLVADSGNGVSAAADPRELLFVNTDLTVTLHRPARGAWICMDSATVLDPSGAGMATTQLADAAGGIGTAQQTLFVEPRGRA